MVDDITIIVAYLHIDPSKQKYRQNPQSDLPISPPSGVDQKMTVVIE